MPRASRTPTGPGLRSRSMCSLLGVPPGSRSQGRKIVDTAPTPDTAVRLRPLVVFRANRSSPTIEVSSPTTPMTLTDHKAISKKNQVHLFFLASLFWHRREAQFFLFSLCPSGGGPCSPRGRDGSFMLRSPIYPLHALFSVPSVLANDTREAPCSSLGRPKWPEPAEDTSGASSC